MYRTCSAFKSSTTARPPVTSLMAVPPCREPYAMAMPCVMRSFSPRGRCVYGIVPAASACCQGASWPARLTRSTSRSWWRTWRCSSPEPQRGKWRPRRLTWAAQSASCHSDRLPRRLTGDITCEQAKYADVIRHDGEHHADVLPLSGGDAEPAPSSNPLDLMKQGEVKRSVIVYECEDEGPIGGARSRAPRRAGPLLTARRGCRASRRCRA